MSAIDRAKAIEALEAEPETCGADAYNAMIDALRSASRLAKFGAAPQVRECPLPHRKNASARLIAGKWGDSTGVNFCFGCGAALEGTKE